MTCEGKKHYMRLVFVKKKNEDKEKGMLSWKSTESPVAYINISAQYISGS